MDLLTRADLVELSPPNHHDIHLSIFMPTHRSGTATDADQIRWRNTLTALESMLADGGMGRRDIDDLLAPGWELHQDVAAWRSMSDGLAVFVRPGWLRMFRIPFDVPELATIGDRFVLGPLLPILTGDEHFLLLAVSQQQVRLLEGTRYRLEEIVLPDVPSNLREVVAPHEPRSDTMARSISPTGRSGPAVFYGHGAADEHFKKDEIERFLRRVASGLDDYLAGQRLPLVLVGLDQMVSLYRGVTGYQHIVDEAVRENPDPLTMAELHAAAWPVIAQRLRADKHDVVARFQELHGTGQASTDPAKLENAAAHGRIDTLLWPARPSCWEQAATTSPTVLQLGANATFAHCELLDRIAVDTLVRSGDIYAFADTPVPGGGEIAGVLRY